MTWTRKKKKYSRPRKAYDISRIREEDALTEKYGLKNKREIWKANLTIARIRNQAKNLITASENEQKKLFNKLNKMGFKISKISDILDLEKEDLLKRRLQSILISRGYKPKQARQLIVHKHVFIKGEKNNTPGHIVKVDEENKIEINKKEGNN